MCHRKTAAFLLVGWLAEVGLQGRCIRHGKAGAVQAPGAMAAPATGLLNLGVQGITHALEQVFEQGQGQPLARHTVSGGGEG